MTRTEEDLGQLPKLCGADVELGNFILADDSSYRSAPQAARMLLRAVADALPAGTGSTAAYTSSSYCQDQRAWTYNPQDWGRRYLKSNGGCAYVDSDHFEICVPEVISAYDHVAAWHAMLRIARQAQLAVNRALPQGQSVEVLVNNSDGDGNAYGSHLSFLLTRRAYTNLFERKLHHQLWLAAYQACAILFSGQGKVGSENGQPAVDFQISQRADFFETLCGPQTTYNRPLVNSRDEALCGPSSTRYVMPNDLLARLHVIFFDNSLSQVSCLLKVGVTQIVLAMIEAECVDPQLLLEDPVDAVVRWSHDPDLHARAQLLSGKSITAIDLQLLFLERAAEFVAAGGCRGLVPRADAILELWADTLAKLARGDFESLAARLDWVLKRQLLRRAERHGDGLERQRRKHLDHLYSSLDPETGLYWCMESAGAVERVVEEAQIEALVHEPPPDTRAWTRAMLLRRIDASAIEELDWDRITVRSGQWQQRRTIVMSNPLSFTRARSESLFASARTTDELLDGLNATPRAEHSNTEQGGEV